MSATSPTPPPERGSDLGPQSAPGGSADPAATAVGEPTTSTTIPTRDSHDKPTKPARADDPLRGSRSSAIYAGVIALGVVLVLLIIFIAQNTEQASVRFLVWDGSAPQAVLLLIAAAAGLFLAGFASTLRILQLRRRVKRERKR